MLMTGARRRNRNSSYCRVAENRRDIAFNRSQVTDLGRFKAAAAVVVRMYLLPSRDRRYRTLLLFVIPLAWDHRVMWATNFRARLADWLERRAS